MMRVKTKHHLSILFISLLIMFMGSDSVISQTASQKTQLILLGTGTPNADPDRSGPSLAIVVGDASYIVDFGPGGAHYKKRQKQTQTNQNLGRRGLLSTHSLTKK